MNHQHTLLAVDDSVQNLEILVNLLDDYDIIEATSARSAMDIIAKGERIDLILLDIQMPEIDGYEFCRHLKSHDETSSIPVIFITANNDEASIAKAYGSGGIDYVTKPFKPTELIMRIKTQLRFQALISELEFLATRDSLTGLNNRRMFFSESNRLIRRAGNNELSAVMIDIDHFKQINDTHGHHVGDKVITAIAAVLQETAGNNGVLGRLGGEEFAIVSSGDCLETICDKIETLHREIEKIEIHTDSGERVRFTISSGIAQLDGAKVTVDDILKSADQALYKAKREGRNRIVTQVHTSASSHTPTAEARTLLRNTQRPDQEIPN